ncbi:MAG: carbohydrate ABC transporter permease [Planctomycetota bacterium]
MTRRARRVWPHLVLVPVSMLMLVPIVWLAISAFKRAEDFFETLFFPVNEDGGLAIERLTIEHFHRLFTEVGILRSLANSFFLSSTLAILASLCCAAAGYALARLRFRGAGGLTVLVLAILVVPPPLLLAPTYELMHQLDLLDSYLAIILPGMAPAFGVFLFRQATVQSVPRELLEAARLDGMGELGIFANVALPLLRPMLGAFVMITYLAMWNNFITPQVLLHSPEKMPLAVTVANMKGVYFTDYGLQMAATLLSVAPVLVLFLMLQRDFVSGLASGAVKG